MRYTQVWSLRRGSINPPEPLCDLDQQRVQASTSDIQHERDQPMTVEQMWREQGKQCGYRLGIRRVA